MGSLRLLWLLALCGASFAQPGLVGGWRDRSPSDRDVQEALRFAVRAFNKGNNSRYYFKASQVTEAKSQVVAGMKYSFTVELVPTVCAKSGSNLENVDLEHCEVSSRAEQEKQICTFQVWTRPWLESTELLHMSCKAATS